MRKQKGLSLVELMISITLALILMAGVVQLFMSSRATFTAQQGMSRVQETGRLAIDMIAQDVRMGGVTGFSGRDAAIFSDIAPVTLQNNYVEGLSVLSPAQANGVSAVAGDVLVIRGATEGLSSSITANVLPGLLTVPVSTVVAGGCNNGARINGLCVGEPAIIADYFKAWVFLPTELNVVGANLTIAHNGTWGADLDPFRHFTLGAQVSPLRTIIYYVGTGASNRRSLFQSIDGVPLELLEGVRDISITYSRNDAPENFLDATDALGGLWNDENPTVSLRIELLVESLEDNVLDSPQTYTFAGQNVPAPDRRIYQVFSTTIALRNQLK